MIYLQGGGYCADAKSCAQNAAVPIAGANYGEAKFRGWAQILGQRGVFNISTAQNPVSGWHHVFIPYCTGDLHGGEKENVRIPGVPSLQQFVGRRNYANNLRVIAGYFRNIGDVALVGSSAGGAGVLLNYEQTVAAFGGRSVAALVDSSPILPPSDFRTDCLFDKLIAAFDLRLPPDCPACRDGKAGGLVNLYGHLSQKYPQGRFALASQDTDIAGVALYNEHSRACGGAGVDIFKFRKSLYTLRDRYIGRDWATFLPPGLQHTLTQDDGLFLRKRRGLGVSAAEWLARINDPQPSHVPKANLR